MRSKPVPQKESKDEHIRELFKLIASQRVVWAAAAKAERLARLLDDKHDDGDGEDDDEGEKEEDEPEETGDGPEDDPDSHRDWEEDGKEGEGGDAEGDDCDEGHDPHQNGSTAEDEGGEEENDPDAADEVLEVKPCPRSSSFGMQQKRERLARLREEIASLRTKLHLYLIGIYISASHQCMGSSLKSVTLESKAQGPARWTSTFCSCRWRLHRIYT